MPVRFINFILLIFFPILNYSQEKGAKNIIDQDYHQVINSEIELYATKHDSVFIHNQFYNAFLKQCFSDLNESSFQSKPTMLEEVKRAILNISEHINYEELTNTKHISSSFSNFSNVYFFDINIRVGESKSNDGTTVLRNLFFIDKKRNKLIFSEPFFSTDKMYSIIFVNFKGQTGFAIYIKENGIWIRNGFVVCSIS